MLVWVGGATGKEPENRGNEKTENKQPPSLDAGHHTRDSRLEGERRQLTVQFIDLVGSTTLSQQLDPEEYHARVVAYQAACRQVIARYDGHIAQYLGDGVLVYFGYPAAHEEDAVRAVRSGLEIVAALDQLEFTPPLQVRIGIHTGPVMVGEIGTGERTERLALGDTPNIAARVQSKAEPNTVFISQATHRLVQGFFRCEALGPESLKNVSVPMDLYRVHGEGEAHTRFEVSVQKGLTPLVGRAEELALLHRHWERTKEGTGQAMLLNGEPGIGKSRLVQELKEQVIQEGAVCIEFRCSPYYQNTAWYPIVEHLQRLLQFQRDDAPQAKLEKLAQTLTPYRFPQADTLPLLAALLTLPQPEGSPPLTLSPQRQKQKTHEALVAWLLEEAERQAVYCPWEDVHWADPSSLEFLNLLIEQAPTTRLYVLLTFRPEFVPPWGSRFHMSQLTLSRLGRNEVREMSESVASGKVLPAQVIQQIVAKTDGVPLFVEELTKTVVESGLLKETEDHYELTGPLPPLAIPATLQDSLMARLDRLATVKEVTQTGAALGREFSYELLRAVSPMEEELLQQALVKLVDAEVLYQRGLPPQAQYIFKHALIQDTAYQSLLKSRRQQYHQQIVRVLEEQFPDTKETQPELLAHHYTEASLIEQAIPYWQQAGQRASQRSAHAEAISHLTTALELLKALPDTPERAQHELSLQISLGAPLMASKGFAAPEVEQTYARARALCEQEHVGDTPQLFAVLWGLRQFYHVRGEFQTGLQLCERLLTLAQTPQDPELLLEAHFGLGSVLSIMGELDSAQKHLEHGIALYDPQKHRYHTLLYGQDPGVSCLSLTALTLWFLGYPEQALNRMQAALILAQELSHPLSLAFALSFAAVLHQSRREGQLVQERAEAVITVSTEQGFALMVAWGTYMRGWALTEQGQGGEGLRQVREGIVAYRATGAELAWPYQLALLAEAYGRGEQPEKGLSVIDEALAVANKTGERLWEAELYRLKGELMLQCVSQKPEFPSQEAEACFQKAIEIARRQNAKSLELRAVMSLSRLWQQQGKRDDARELLAEVYNWFTEGFDTKDLQEAKTLLEALEKA